MQGWTKGTLGELCSIGIGGTPSRNNPDYWDTAKETGNHWVSIKDLNRRTVCGTAEQITDLGVRNSNVKLQPKGTILLSFKLSIGRVAFAGCDIFTNEAIAGLRSEELAPEFLFYGLQQWDLLQNVDQAIKGATLNKDKLKKIEFEYPESQVEQAKIAEILSTLDRAIEQTEALIAKQQRIKTGLMQDLLTMGIDEHGNIRSEATHAFKDSPLGRIPVEWDISNLEHVGHWFSGGTPSKANSQYWNGGVPWICPKDMKTFELSSSIDTISEYAIVTGTRLMPKNAVYIVIRGMILAHTFPVGYGMCAAAFNQDVKAVIANSRMNSRYLAYWFVSHGHEFIKLTTTATHGTKRFDIEELFAVPIGIPSIKEQEKIVRIFDKQQTHVDQMVDSARKLRSLKAGLMQDLLTGKRRVTDLLASQTTQE